MLAAVLAMFLLAVLWASVLAAGAVLAWRGARGVADRLPRCAACGYLLVGYVLRPTRCPECGANLAAPAAVRLGTRRVHRPLISAGVAVMLAGLGAIPLVMSTGPVAPAAAPAAAAPPPAPRPLPRWRPAVALAARPTPDPVSSRPAGRPAGGGVLPPSYDVDTLFARDDRRTCAEVAAAGPHAAAVTPLPPKVAARRAAPRKAAPPRRHAEAWIAPRFAGVTRVSRQPATLPPALLVAETLSTRIPPEELPGKRNRESLPG